MKVRVLFWSNDFEVRILPAVMIQEDILYVKKLKRIIVITEKPYYYKKGLLYFVHWTDLHNHNPKNGSIISEERKKQIMDFIKKNKLDEKIGITKNFKIEDLSPHMLTEASISRIIQDNVFQQLLGSLAGRLDKFTVMILLLLGICIGSLITLIAIGFKVGWW